MVAGGDYVHFVVEYGGKIRKVPGNGDCPSEAAAPAREPDEAMSWTAHLHLTLSQIQSCRQLTENRAMSRH
jgi:hypothetical protein